jgi:hypothetical protein
MLQRISRTQKLPKVQETARTTDAANAIEAFKDTETPDVTEAAKITNDANAAEEHRGCQNVTGWQANET